MSRRGNAMSAPLDPRLVQDDSIQRGMVRIATTMALPALLREHGVDPGPVLAEFGLEPEFYTNPDNTIAFATSARLLARCADVTGCAHFGLQTGQRAGISTLGVLGFLMQSSPTVRQALGDLARHFRVHNPSAAIDLVAGGDSAALVFTILQPGADRWDQLLDGAMAIAFNLMRSLCGPDWRPIEVRIAHARPQDEAPFRQFFHARVVFDASETSIAFDTHWLDRPRPGADPLLRLWMQQRVQILESHANEDLVAHLRRILPTLIVARDATAATLARHAGMGVRTLNRRLAAEGTSFANLRDETRKSVALQLLEGTRMPVKQLADHLGYANASAFTRAFSRWTGMGPADWRKSRRQHAAGKSSAD